MKIEKLELKHLSGYLPYGLKIKLSNEGIRNIDEEYPSNNRYLDFEINDMLLGKEVEIEMTHESGYSVGFIGLNEITPILRPLRLLTEEIIHEGEYFVPALVLSELFIAPEYRDRLQIIDNNKVNYITVGYDLKDNCRYQLNRNPERMEFSQVEKLFEWHFDIYNLIESGLAIDSTTVGNPYDK